MRRALLLAAALAAVATAVHASGPVIYPVPPPGVNCPTCDLSAASLTTTGIVQADGGVLTTGAVQGGAIIAAGISTADGGFLTGGTANVGAVIATGILTSDGGVLTAGPVSITKTTGIGLDVGNGGGGTTRSPTVLSGSYEAYAAGTVNLNGAAAATTTAFKLDTAQAYTTSAHVLLDVKSGTTKWQVTGDGVSRPALGVAHPAVTLSTCGASGTATPGVVENDATGGTGGKVSKLCVCVLEADGTTYKWRNLLKATDTTGNTTTCPDT